MGNRLIKVRYPEKHNGYRIEVTSETVQEEKGEETMPKLKTHRSGAKRYKVTASGKILRRKAGIGHLLQHKDGSRKRKIFKMCEISGTHFKLISKELPYKKYSR